MRIIEEEQLDFDDVLIQPKRSTINSRKEVTPFREFGWVGNDGKQHSLNCIPITISNMGSIGIPRMAKIAARLGYMCSMEKHIPLIDLDNMYSELENLALANQLGKNEYTQRISPSIGIKEDIGHLVDLSKKHLITSIIIDVPNGYIPNLIRRIHELRDAIPTALLIAGNVVTPDIAQDIIFAGAKCVKLNIGNGSVCRTRLETGVGRPTLSTVIECADACHQVGGFCMSDGGVKNTGDIMKALGAGADFVMSGSLFSGCDEAEGDVVCIDGKNYKKYYGMSSHYAQEKHFNGIRKYSASEGRTKLVPCTGALEDKLNDISGGLRSAMTYVGAQKLKNIPKQTTFYRVRRQVNDLFANCKDF